MDEIYNKALDITVRIYNYTSESPLEYSESGECIGTYIGQAHSCSMFIKCLDSRPDDVFEGCTNLEIMTKS